MDKETEQGIIQENEEMFKSEKNIRDFIDQVFWRNAMIDRDADDPRPLGKKEINQGIRNIAFHIAKMYKEIQ